MTSSFNSHHRRYEAWFSRHEAAFSELLAVRALLPWEGKGLEIGVGTGRFSAPLGVEVGVDPSICDGLFDFEIFLNFISLQSH
jgi:hypothetical protein